MEGARRFGLPPRGSARVGGLSGLMGIGVGLVAFCAVLLLAIAAASTFGLAGVPASKLSGAIAFVFGALCLVMAAAGFRAINSGVSIRDGEVVIDGIFDRRRVSVDQVRGFAREGSIPYVLCEDGTKIRITGLVLWGSRMAGSKFIDEGLTVLNKRLRNARSN